MKREASARLWERRKAGAVAQRIPDKPKTKQETPEYRAWINIKQRCYNPRHAAFKNYGGRGIFVCAHWYEDFKQFLADVGPRPFPDYSIDRKDNELGYLCPLCLPPDGNCKWSTRTEQTKNRRPIPTENLGKHMAAVWAGRDKDYRQQFSKKMKVAANSLSPEAQERRRQGGVKGGKIGGVVSTSRRWGKPISQ